eukprot:NODE_6215_length_559_cov_90.479167_g6050_i0.p1 GENE.NODE_6215_length_559_cov_90.479167_g6050_i0~~NODE_6215_length_559_cov_90.479167_g6050_i0.p1  ORF type:complete len:143 (-),score=30.29 NODE_6215_length_559_cov_90.479167_g6050_i0:76-504(-)
MVLGQGLTDLCTRFLLVYCGYKSFQSIETESWKDDAHWLTFWMLYAFFQFLEFFLDFIYSYILFEKIPFYYELKLGIFIYIGLCGGSKRFYEACGKKLIIASQNTVSQLGENENVKNMFSTVQNQQKNLQAQLQQTLNRDAK